MVAGSNPVFFAQKKIKGIYFIRVLNLLLIQKFNMFLNFYDYYCLIQVMVYDKKTDTTIDSLKFN